MVAKREKSMSREAKKHPRGTNSDPPASGRNTSHKENPKPPNPTIIPTLHPVARHSPPPTGSSCYFCETGGGVCLRLSHLHIHPGPCPFKEPSDFPLPDVPATEGHEVHIPGSP